MSDDILAKVRKILAKAEDLAAKPEEAETYTAKAAELVAAYGIDWALLAQTEPGSDVVGDRVVLLDPPYALDKAGLLSARLPAAVPGGAAGAVSSTARSRSRSTCSATTRTWSGPRCST